MFNLNLTKNKMKGLSKVEIYRAIINGLDAIPKPLDGKGPEPNYEYCRDMKEAFKLSRKIRRSWIGWSAGSRYSNGVYF